MLGDAWNVALPNTSFVLVFASGTVPTEFVRPVVVESTYWADPYQKSLLFMIGPPALTPAFQLFVVLLIRLVTPTESTAIESALNPRGRYSRRAVPRT